MRQQYNRFYLVVIADYNDDDAHGIVHDNLYYWFDERDLGIIEYDRVDVSVFNTVETGYMLARRALNPLSPSRRQVFFVNTAPRMDDAGQRLTNQGEGFVWAELSNGKHVFAVNSGYSLSFVKPEITELRPFNVPDSPESIPMLVEALKAASPARRADNIGVGQFRSGYIYPIIVALALSRDTEPISPQFGSLFGAPLDASIIPDVPENAIVYSDGYGNLKTTIAPENLAADMGRHVVVEWCNREVIAQVRAAIFDVPVNHFSLAPGSTVLVCADGRRRQFVELVLRGGNAAAAFSRTETNGPATLPKPGDEIKWRLASKEDFARLAYSDEGYPPDHLLCST